MIRRWNSDFKLTPCAYLPSWGKLETRSKLALDRSRICACFGTRDVLHERDERLRGANPMINNIGPMLCDMIEAFCVFLGIQAFLVLKDVTADGILFAIAAIMSLLVCANVGGQLICKVERERDFAVRIFVPQYLLAHRHRPQRHPHLGLSQSWKPLHRSRPRGLWLLRRPLGPHDRRAYLRWTPRQRFETHHHRPDAEIPAAAPSLHPDCSCVRRVLHFADEARAGHEPPDVLPRRHKAG